MACKNFLAPLEEKGCSTGGAWLPYASQHPAMFFATLNYATMHVDAIAGSFWSPENKRVLQQKSALMSQINAGLTDTTVALTESTICGVALLTIAEVRFFCIVLPVSFTCESAVAFSKHRYHHVRGA